jgi:polysaccharide chain length determinant protein (PEP-CTERM system associated)
MNHTPTSEPETNILESLGRVLGTVKRRRWWIILPACLVILATVAVSLWLPNHFTSEAKILILEQQIPQGVDGAASNTSPADKRQIIAQEILSRDRLVAIADQFGLYARRRRELTADQLAEGMRKAIEIQPVDAASARNSFNAFGIAFTADRPELAQQITRTLANLFIESNSKTQQSQASNTQDLLKEQLTHKRQQAAQLEERRRTLEAQYLEVAAGPQAANEYRLQDLRMQLRNTTSNLNRARQQRLYLESVLSSTIASSLAKLRAERNALLLRFTPEYPAVVQKGQEIARMEALLNAQKAGAGGADSVDVVTEDPALGQLRAQLKANSQEIADASNDEDRLKASTAEEENRLKAIAASGNSPGEAPLRQQRLDAIEREGEMLTREILDLENRLQQSGLVADMERRDQGQQFRLIDSASLPVSPSSPNRLKISLGGIGGGIALGLALAFLMDSRARSFYTEQQLSQRFGVPLTIGLPMLYTPRETRRLSRRLAFEWLAGLVLIGGALTAEYYVYRLDTGAIHYYRNPFNSVPKLGGLTDE